MKKLIITDLDWIWYPELWMRSTNVWDMTSTVIVPTSESDSELEQTTYLAESSGVKCKADDVADFVDETASEAMDDSDNLIDDTQEMASLLSEAIIDSASKEYAPCKTTSVCISFISCITDSVCIFEASTIISQSTTPPPPKKLKKECSRASKVTNDNNVMPPPSTQVPTGYYDNIVPPPSTQVPSNAGKTAMQEVIKPHGQYCNNDLPIPADSKWVKVFYLRCFSGLEVSQIHGKFLSLQWQTHCRKFLMWSTLVSNTR
jgi:hypothetical protein